MGVAALIFALVAVGASGAKYDAKAHLLSAHGAAAADWNTPNATVARVAAERAALKRAERALGKALELLRCGDQDVRAQSLKAATVNDERYGSDGSVELTLELSTAELHCGK